MAAFVIAKTLQHTLVAKVTELLFFFLFLTCYSNARMGEASSLPNLAVLGQLL